MSLVLSSQSLAYASLSRKIKDNNYEWPADIELSVEAIDLVSAILTTLPGPYLFQVLECAISNPLSCGHRTTPHPRRNPHPFLVPLRPLPSLHRSLIPHCDSRLPPNVDPRLSPQLSHRQEAVRHRRRRDSGGDLDHPPDCARSVAGRLRGRGGGSTCGCARARCNPSSHRYGGKRDGEGSARGPPTRQPNRRPPTVRSRSSPSVLRDR